MKSLQPGDPASIGGYRLLGRLGAGGMGEVFFGRSVGGRPVAVKLPVSDLSWEHTLAFSRDSRMVAAGTDDSVVHLWSTTRRSSAAPSPRTGRQKTLAVAYDDDTIRLGNVSSPRVTKTITLSSNESAAGGTGSDRSE
jgi:WD40 repeat protein